MEPDIAATTQAATFNGPLLAAWLVTVGALAVAGVAGRKLTVGVGEGLFVAGLSGLLLLNYTVLGGGRLPLPVGGPISLAVLWFLVAVWIEHRDGQGEARLQVSRKTVRHDLALHAVAVAGLVAVALAAVHGTPVVQLCLLLPLTGGLYLRRGSPLARCGFLAVVVALLVSLAPADWIGRRQAAVSATLLMAGLVSLLVVIARILAEWRRRVRIWHNEPERLVEPPPTHTRLYGLVVVLGVLVGLGGVFVPTAVATPLAVVLAALAVLTVGHIWRSNAIGELGLALVAESIITAALAWLPASPAGPLLGCGVAGVLLLWLARFWHQQLDDGRPWTTAGRLIPAARQLSHATAGGQLLFAAAWALRPVDGGPAGWQAYAAALVLLLQSSMLVRDAAAGHTSAAPAACLALLAVLVPIRALLAGWGLVASPAVLLAAAGLVLALAANRRPALPEGAWVWNAYIGGLIPAAVAYGLVMQWAVGDWGWVPAGVAAACVLAAWLARAARRRVAQAISL